MIMAPVRIIKAGPPSDLISWRPRKGDAPSPPGPDLPRSDDPGDPRLGFLRAFRSEGLLPDQRRLDDEARAMGPGHPRGDRRPRPAGPAQALRLHVQPPELPGRPDPFDRDRQAG